MDPVLELGTAMHRFAELSAAAFGNEPVPSCPGWTIDDLTEHVGTVHRWAAAILLSGQRLDDPHGVLVTEPRSEWYASTASALLEVVRAVPADEPTPNFARVQETAAFWPRRQMHETTIHVVDASLALGLGLDGWPIAPELAADGVEEVLSVFFARMTARGQRPHLRGRVRFHATDVDQRWVVGEAPDSLRTPVLQFDGSYTGIDGEVRGTAAELYLGLWGRLDRDRLVTDGAAARELVAGPLVP
ncbi:maleylpyruvate isomerase family mycothiol-dependent enzyme [Aeromicrobium alkaliterrae]|uniref:Maleylpyruvate isomerase family mycothiol-dependent enzyme n=1 Tax=Aeromicrobium alkaliterrae TaxID=302168 RepID=A0ABP4WIU7_9ACTN